MLVGFYKSLPLRVIPSVGQRACGVDADQCLFGLALRRQDRLIDHDRAADELGVAAGLLVLVEEVDGVGTAQTQIDGVDVVG